MTTYDPFRGYDQWKTASPYDDEIEDNSAIEGAFADYSGPFDLYRSVYKYTPCGPTVGVTFYGEWPKASDMYSEEWGPGCTYDPPGNRTFYCDDLRQFGTWKDLQEAGLLITEIQVSSIVEGVDQCTTTHYIEDLWDSEPEEISKAFWDAVEAVNEEVNEIWYDTHGCETCAKHWHEIGEPYHHTYCNTMGGCDGQTIVWEDCPECEGYGALI